MITILLVVLAKESDLGFFNDFWAFLLAFFFVCVVMQKKNPSTNSVQIEGFVPPSKSDLARASKERRKLLNERNASHSPSSSSPDSKKRDSDKEKRVDLKRKDNISPKGLYV
jgi:hypothetical protein